MRKSWIVAVILMVPMVGRAQSDPSPYAVAGDAWLFSNNYEAAPLHGGGSKSAVTGIQMWIFDGYDPGPNYGFLGQFDWEILTNVNGLPGTLITSGSAIPTNTYQTQYGAPYSPYYPALWTLNITPTVLPDTGMYWIGIHNTDQAGVYVDNNFSWAATGDTTEMPGATVFMGGGGVLNQPVDLQNVGYGNRLAYGIEYSDLPVTTPEPSSLALLGIGLVGLGSVVRKRTIS